MDKTRYIPLIEQAGDYLFFLRPRRFGKSLWLGTLEAYYDVLNKDKITTIFKNTWIADNLTPEAGNYLILRFNFSMVDPNPSRVEESFNETCLQSIEDFVFKYREILPGELQNKLLSYKKADRVLKSLLSPSTFKEIQHKLYVLIDEYDNFTNTILSEYSSSTYHEITHGSGFLRYFYNILKGATTGPNAPLAKIFITGVSPITMDDVTSGFNIGTPITLYPQFNELAGFTQEDVKRIFEYYIDVGWLNQPIEKLIEIASTWYNSYKFDGYSSVFLYNPDMIFYFIREVGTYKRIPDILIDDNVKMDYTKLKYLVIIDRKFNGNFSVLQKVMDKGAIISPILTSFPLESLLKQSHFISHLFYLGILSFKDKDILNIPNQTVWNILFEYLRNIYEDLDIFRLDIFDLQHMLRDMAYLGRWYDVFKFLSKEIEKQGSIRDFITGESSIKILQAAYLNITKYFTVKTETELNKGFADIYLEPFWERDENVKYGYLIEIKYVPRSKKLTDEHLSQLRNKAKEQLEQYSKDIRISEKFSSDPEKRLIKIYQIWYGWEMVEIG